MTSTSPAVTVRARARSSWLTIAEVRWAALSLAAFALAALAGAFDAPAGATAALYAVCYAAGGWEPAAAGVRALRDRVLDVDLLMIVAALAAAGIGQAFDGGLLIVIFATSGALEALATKRTEDSVRALLGLTPETATRILDSGEEMTVEAETLAPGDLVAIRPGERVPGDGTVLLGASEVDEATITGESVPVAKAPGDRVFAGTFNGTGALRVRVDRDAGDTVIARIVDLVASASETKAERQLFIERVEQRYSALVVAATLALLSVPLALGAPLDSTLLRAMTFMIVASPCAVVLATMPPLLSAIATAGRHGVLVKSAVVMEQLAHTAAVAFDKTGTLTRGTPVVTRVDATGTHGLDADALLALAAAVEASSEHPLGVATVSAARARGLKIVAASGFASQPGVGVAAEVGGSRVAVSRALGDEPAVTRSGETLVVVTVDGVASGTIALVDELRDGAARAVSSLTEVLGSAPVLLTGDNEGAAARAAAATGITEVHAALLPSGKVAHVHRLAGRGHVMVVGDGVNDAPMLAAAGTGVAMGRHGSDLALETSDAVLVRDDLQALAPLIVLARRARRVVLQNLVFAGTVIVVLVGLDLAGRLPLPLGVAGHEGSTIVVGLNGLRLLSSRAWR